MTDEEMAEEWIKDHSGLIGSYAFVKYDYDSLKQAFLAGLKAGRDMVKTYLNTVAYMQGAIQQKNKSRELLSKARDLILKLYDAGRDVLMCRAEEKVYDNLEDAINDRRIERFLEEIE